MIRFPTTLNRVNRRRALGIAAASLVAGGGARLSAASPRRAESGIVRFGRARQYTVQHSVTFTNGNIDLASVELWLPVPQNIPEQTVTGVKVEPDVPAIVDKSGQVAVAKLALTESLPAADKSIALKGSYRVASRSRLRA